MRHNPVVALQHLARGFGVIALVDVPQAGRTEGRQEQASRHSQQNEVIGGAMVECVEHSVVPVQWFGLPLPARGPIIERDGVAARSIDNPKPKDSYPWASRNPG